MVTVKIPENRHFFTSLSVYLVSDYSDYIFSSSTTYTYERFLEQKIPTRLSRSGLLDFLHDTVTGSRYGYLIAKDDDSIFLSYSLPSNGLTAYAYLIFAVPKKAFLEYFHTESGPLLVLEGNIVIASFPDEHRENQEKLIEMADRLYEEDAEDYYEFIEEDTRFCCYLDKNSDLTYIVSVSDTEAMTEIREVMRLFLLSLLFILLIGTLAILILPRSFRIC